MSKDATKTCPRCLGAKFFDHFRHVDGGACYRCKGAGVVFLNGKATVGRPLSRPRPAGFEDVTIADESPEEIAEMFNRTFGRFPS